jgi:hypothetical protein
MELEVGGVSSEKRSPRHEAMLPQTPAEYLAQGMAVIPVAAGKKYPEYEGWQNLRLTQEDGPCYWTDSQNVGLLTGEPSGWRVDVDLDVEEAIAMAGRFLPPTLTSGRKSRPHSHWWFRSEHAQNREWKDTDGKKRLIELRATGRQTIVAPSTHPSGERCVWHSETGLGVAEISATELEERVRELATATLIARHLPPIRDETSDSGGGRHDYAMALAGFLLRPGRLGESLVLKMLKVAWDARGWPHKSAQRDAYRDLERIVQDTATNISAGERVVGGPTLEDMEPGMVGQLRKYWGWNREECKEEPQEEGKEVHGKEADRLIRYARVDAEALFRDQHGAAHALVGGEPVPLNSRCYSWLRWLVWKREERSVTGEALRTAAGTLAAHAEFSGKVRELHTRAAWHEGTLYYELAPRRVIEVDAKG